MMVYRTDAAESRSGKIWIPPFASLAFRRPPLRTTITIRGALLNDGTHREIVYENTLERDLAYILLNDKDVEVVHEQPPAVCWIDDIGRRRSHTFDFLVTRRDGTREATAVKPASRVIRSGLASMIKSFRADPPRGLPHCASSRA